MSKALMTIGDVSIGIDEHGRMCLNDLHRASGEGEKKSPNRWTRLGSTKALIVKLQSTTPYMASETSPHGESPSTYAHELLAVSYAGWISPSFQLDVNQAFLDSRRQDATMPALHNPSTQVAIDTLYRIDAVEYELGQAREARIRIEAKTDMLIDEQRMTLEAFVLKNGLLRQCPRSAWKAGGKWCSEFCVLYNIAARAVKVHGKAWQTEQAYPPEALMAWVDKLAREGGQGDLGNPVRKIT